MQYCEQMKISIIPLVILPIESDGFHLIVSGEIHYNPATFLIDTGASRTVFDKKLILDYVKTADISEIGKFSTGLGTDSMPTHTTRLEQLRLGSLEIVDYDAVIIDLQFVHQSYQTLELPLIHAVIGGDILNKYNAVINYKKKELKLYH